jgi:hypothetical protein
MQPMTRVHHVMTSSRLDGTAAMQGCKYTIAAGLGFWAAQKQGCCQSLRHPPTHPPTPWLLGDRAMNMLLSLSIALWVTGQGMAARSVFQVHTAGQELGARTAGGACHQGNDKHSKAQDQPLMW